MFMFESLEVYQKALTYFKRIEAVISSNPDRRNYVINDQLQRAALSISLNIAEGNGRSSVKDRIHFFYIARGSLFETIPLLDIFRDKQLLSEQQYNDFRSQADTLSKMLSGLIEATKKQT